MNWSELREALFEQLRVMDLGPHLRLPVVPQTLREFLLKCEQPNVATDELAAIVERDPALTCELLKNVNSALAGVRTRQTSARQALNMLGVRRARLFMIMAAVSAKAAAAKSAFFDPQLFQLHAQERAYFAQLVAKALRADVDLAYTAALLQDFVLPMLTQQYRDKYQTIFSRLSTTPDHLHHAEHMVLGWDHAEAGAYAMTQWSFPDELICCGLLHTMGLKVFRSPDLRETAAAAVAASGLLPDPWGQAKDGVEQLRALETQLNGFSLRRFAEKTDELMAEQISDAPNWVPLAKRIDQVTNVAAPAARAAATTGSQRKPASANAAGAANSGGGLWKMVSSAFGGGK